MRGSADASASTIDPVPSGLASSTTSTDAVGTAPRTAEMVGATLSASL
jgi:hypothetical protein